MPRRTIASENKVGLGGNRFPRLDFKAKGERHRVLLFQKDADGQAVVWQEYVHSLRCPQFGEDGMVLMTLKDSKRDEGEKYEDYDLKWVGSPLCLGDPAVIEEQGYDPGNCPICAAIDNGAPAEANLKPFLQFSANIVDYALAPGSWQVQRPLSASVVTWKFSSTVYDDIISQQEQHGELLQKQDLTLECTNATWKNFKMGVMSPSGWAESPGGGAYLAELLGDPANIANDEQLREACGRPAKRVFMEEDLAIVLRKWRRALPAEEAGPFGQAQMGGANGQPQDLAAGVEALLGQAVSPEQIAQVQALKAEAQAEIARITGNDASGLDEFTSAGNHQTAAEEAKAAAAAAPPREDDPFGNGGPAASATTTATSAPAAEPASPTEPESAASAASSEEPKSGTPVSFDQMINMFGGIK